MTARTDVRKIVEQRLVPAVADLEKVVHRNGYLRTLSITVVSLGFVGVVGQLLGLAWLRFAYGTLAAALFILAATVAFASTATLRQRLARSEELLHEYADAVQVMHPIAVKEWHQEVVIERNGDARIRRRHVLGAAPDDDRPHHLTVKLVYDGRSELTALDRRRIDVTVRHSNLGDGNNGVRVLSTVVWSTTEGGRPRLDVYVHLGRVIREGDVVTVEWDWPACSKDLMSGAQPESFDVSFQIGVARFEHLVIFREAVGGRRLRIRDLGAPGLERTEVGRDVHVRFSGNDPQLGTRYGFVADLE